MTKSLNESLHGGDPFVWAQDFLTLLGVDLTASNLQVIYSWMFIESGGGGGDWNPLNTSMPWPGATNYNSSGVKNYKTRQDGLGATVKVIHESPYRSILFDLEIGDSTDDLVEDITSSIWGTHSLPLKDLPVDISTIGVEMQFVPSPHVPTKPGRTGAAKWNPANPNQVILENGARAVGDKPVTTAADRYYVTVPVTGGEKIVGISYSIFKSGPDKGKPDGKGFTAFGNNEASFDYVWKD